MLDAVVAFTRGGEVLWRWSGAKGNNDNAVATSNAPLDALVRSCLLEDRASEPSFNWDAPGIGGGSYTLKWSLHNGLGLVFVAISQRALRLPYVDALLTSTRDAFAQQFYPKGPSSSSSSSSSENGGSGGDFSSFDGVFERLADAAERSSSSGAATTTKTETSPAKKESSSNGKKKMSSSSSLVAEEEKEAAAAAAAAAAPEGADGDDDGDDGGDNNNDGPAINLEAATARLKLGNKRGSKSSLSKGGAGAGTGGGAVGGGAVGGGGGGTSKSTKEARVWQGQARKGAALAALDFSDGKPPPSAEGDASAAAAAASAEGTEPDDRFDFTAKSRVDADDDEEEDDEEEDFDAGFVFDDDAKTAAAAAAAPASTSTATTATKATKTKPSSSSSSSKPSSSSTGVLSSFVRSLGLAVAGSAALTDDDVSPALEALKKKLMERNVAEPVAEKICASVRASIVGTQHASFTRVASAVRSSVEEALERVLTPRRTVDVLREIRSKRQQQQAGTRSQPYVITFVGVNGVGKSTSLSKIAYWLTSNGVKVSIAACDTFRSGAVEQLKTHAARLRVPLFERGYERDPAKVAAEAIRAAARDGVDCVLVDTAGRMQDNEPLMRALAGLISGNDPDLVLFVGEALVGNDGVDQLTQFNARLLELAPPRNSTAKKNKDNNGNDDSSNPNADAAGATVREGRPCAVDGIVLTKFDTIDEKVGAAVSMVYASGAPVMFVGCGQTYVDLKRLNVRSVVRSLLK